MNFQKQIEEQAVLGVRGISRDARIKSGKIIRLLSLRGVYDEAIPVRQILGLLRLSSDKARNDDKLYNFITF